MLKNRYLLNRDGAVSLKVLIWLAVLFFAVYAGYKFLRPSFSYYMLRTDVEEEAKLAHMYTDESLRERILVKAKAWSVPISSEDIEIIRGSRNIIIRISYSQTMIFFGRYSKTLYFTIETIKPLKEAVGALH
ncbi:MAG: hypothetical protein BMS9Abin23_0275 [Thermodesulfobacteriota bacterium]|nr:MAG: hypothetical protein BMS9Abin23_0275 [Thermodesulfobacteriota bacterium]